MMVMMMSESIDLRIDDEYKITSDKHSYILKVRTSNGRWKSERYSNNIDHALRCYKEHLIKNSGVTEWTELKQLLDDIERNIRAIGDKLDVEVELN